jgi:hypothetical protein
MFRDLDRAQGQALTTIEYNHVRPHSALGYRPPAPAAIAPLPLRINPVALPEMPALT